MNTDTNTIEDEEPKIIRCSTLLCGKPASWRRPATWGGVATGEWHRKCQTCFDRLGYIERSDAGWSRVENSKPPANSPNNARQQHHPHRTMKTEEAQLQQAIILKHDHVLRDRLTKVKTRMNIHMKNVQREIDDINESLAVEYTGHVALLKREGNGWKCVACVDSQNLPPDVPEEFDVCLPIPKPETMPEWEGW